jgi:hypothetical protein
MISAIAETLSRRRGARYCSLQYPARTCVVSAFISSSGIVPHISGQKSLGQLYQYGGSCLDRARRQTLAQRTAGGWLAQVLLIGIV